MGVGRFFRTPEHFQAGSMAFLSRVTHAHSSRAHSKPTSRVDMSPGSGRGTASV